jgi:threonine/homoserine/homoserine lactone efflux protein
MTHVDLPLILLAALVGAGSPGPSNLAIAGASMEGGRDRGLALASGVSTGSLFWSVSAALGLGALMLAHGWLFEVIRYFGAGYLAFLAFKSARSALRPGLMKTTGISPKTTRRAYAKGLGLHLTNPKAILFFGSLYAVGVPQGSSFTDLAIVIAAVAIQSTLIFHGYALIFSSQAMTIAYTRMRRWFDGVAAVFFAAAALKILTARLT